eukprot:Partr_v1_DN25867_c0_g1_i3_m2575 putative Syntaxin 5
MRQRLDMIQLIVVGEYLSPCLRHSKSCSLSIRMYAFRCLKDRYNLSKNAYLSSRADAVEGIERSIAEMASMFGQITDLLRGQEDLARRIEDNTEGIMRNVDGAQQQLLTYMNWISSDRWLMARIFFVLIFFFAVFVLFLA